MSALITQGPFGFESCLRQKGKGHSVLNHDCVNNARSI